MDSNETGQINKKSRNKILNIFLLFGVAIVISYYLFSAPIANRDVDIHIHSGQSINSVTVELKEKGSIRNIFVLKSFISLLKSGNGIVSGDYKIYNQSPVWIVAWQIARGHHNVPTVRVTVREGLSNNEIASLFAENLSGFRKDLFLSSVNDKQGYLFPDTYFFFPFDETDEIVEKLTNNFDSKIKSLNTSIKESGKSLSDIITMASLLEGEAGGKDDIETISGILWKRISKGMPLQVDIDKSTYSKKGLPNKPVNNPGLISIEAAINPKNSPYLYYLHDKNGNVHYAVTFDEHKRNINNYLK